MPFKRSPAVRRGKLSQQCCILLNVGHLKNKTQNPAQPAITLKQCLPIALPLPRLFNYGNRLLCSFAQHERITGVLLQYKIQIRMADVFAKLVKDGGPIGQHMDRAHGYFAFPKLEGELGPRMMFRGKEMIVWSLNNYLGLVNHPEVRRVDAEAAAMYGMGNPMGARMMSGNTTKHDELEKVISEFVEREDTMLLNYGYQGIMSCIDALVNRRDVIVYDLNRMPA